MLRDQFPLGYGARVQEVKVTNLERATAAEVSIEGRGIGIAILSQTGRESRLFRDDFVESLRLLPRDEVSVFHVPDLTSFRQVQGGDHILVSQGGAFVSTRSENSIFLEVFSEPMNRYPLPFFLLFIFGAMFVFMLFVEGVVRARMSWRVGFIKANLSSRDLGVYKFVLDSLYSEDPEAQKKITLAAKRVEERIAQERTGNP